MKGKEMYYDKPDRVAIIYPIAEFRSFSDVFSKNKAIGDLANSEAADMGGVVALGTRSVSASGVSPTISQTNLIPLYGQEPFYINQLFVNGYNLENKPVLENKIVPTKQK